MHQEAVVSSDRLFQVWRYTVSHHQLLLRSNKTDGDGTRLEVLFKDVSFMAVPSLMRGLEVTLCNPSDVDLPFHVSTEHGSNWYRISTNGSVGYVAAVACQFKEDGLEYYDESGLLVEVYP